MSSSSITRAFWLFVLIGIASPISAFVQEVRSLARQGQFIHVLSDQHTRTSGEFKQQTDVLSIGKKLNALMIVEDIDNKPGFYPVKSSITTSACPSDSFLGNLLLHCQQHSLAVENIEFRGPTDASLHKAGCSITAAQIVQLMNTLINQITHYSDAPVLRQTYHKIIQQFMKTSNPLFEQMKIYHKPLKKFVQEKCNEFTAEQFKTMLYAIESPEELKNESLIDAQGDLLNRQKALTFILDFYDQKLIDIQLLHTLYEYQIKSGAYQHIIVCAGGWHIDNIIPVLHKLGYQQVSHFGAAFADTAIDIDQCLAEYCTPSIPTTPWIEVCALSLVLLLFLIILRRTISPRIRIARKF